VMLTESLMVLDMSTIAADVAEQTGVNQFIILNVLRLVIKDQVLV